MNENEKREQNVHEDEKAGEFLSLLMNAECGFAIYLVDKEKHFQLEYISEGFCRLCEGDYEKVMSAFKSDPMFGVDKGYQKIVHQAFQKLLSTGETQDVTYLAKIFTGRECWMNLKLTISKEENGMSKIYGVFLEVTEQIKTQEELRNAMQKNLQNEQALNMACSLAGIWTFTLDLNKKVCYPDQLLQENYHLADEIPDFPESLIAMQLIHPDYEDRYRKMISNLSRNNPVTEEEMRVCNLEGGYSWMRYTWHITEYENGNPRYAVGYAKFIDSEKQQQARMDLERKKLLGGDKKLTAYAIINLKSEIVEDCNDYVWESGICKNESLGKLVNKISKAIPYEEERKAYQHNHETAFLLDNYRKGITSLETRMRMKDEQGYFHWQCNVENVMNDPDSDTVYLYEYLYDIHYERLLEDFIEGTAKTEYEMIGTLAFDTGQFYSIGAEDDFKEYQMASYEKLCEEYIENSIPQDEREEAYARYEINHIRKQLHNCQKSFYFIERNVDNEGAIRYKKVSFTKFENTEGACFYNRRDITETIEKEELANEELRIALKEAEEATAAKSAFLSRMSHELRTPLNAINGYTAVIEQYLDKLGIQDGTLHNCIESIFKAGKYQVSIIGDLLDIQQIESGKLSLFERETDFNGFLENIVAMIQPEADEKNIEFTFQRSDILQDTYQLDSVRLQQILLNLLYNAIKFTEPGGKVWMTAEVLSTDGKTTVLQYVISDTGIGMSEDFQKNYLFMSFAQEHQGNTSPYDGCGTGLSICKEILNLMGGTINCVSKKGEGSTFTVTVPVKNYTRKRRREHKEYVNYDLSGIRVLLCEDNPMNQDMEKRLLERMHCEVDIADDGAIGLQLFNESPEGYYQVVLMDIRMPNMDGLETTRQIRLLNRADAKAVPILAVSANAFDEDVKASLAAGMNEHLAKPVNAKIFYKKIEQYCNLKSLQ